MAPPKEEMIDAFRNKLYNCVLEDSSTGVGTVTGIYLDVVKNFQFRDKKKALNFELEFDGFKLPGHVSKVQTGIKIVINHTILTVLEYNAHFNFSAVGGQIQGIKTWLDFKLDVRDKSTTSFMCCHELGKSNGYMNSRGAFKIRMQINLLNIADKYKAYQFPRAFRLDAFFTWKASFESSFARAIQHAKHQLTSLEQNPAWDSIISKKLFWQMEEDDFFLMLRKSLGNNMVSWDILWTGSLKFLFDPLKKPPKELTVFLKRKFHLFTLSVSVKEMLEKVERLEYIPLLEPELNSAGFESFERELMLNGCVVLQCLYVSLAWGNIKMDIETATEAHKPDIPPPADAREAHIPPPAVAREAGIPPLVAHEAGIPPLVAHEAGIQLAEAREAVLPPPLAPGEEDHLKAVMDVGTGHAFLLDNVLYLGDVYRNLCKRVYSSQPPSQYKSKLKEVISQFHANAQIIASLYFSEEEENLPKDEYQDFPKWKYVRTKEERTMLKSNESKEEAQKVGYRGEEYVFSYLQDQYKDDDDVEVRWSNEGKESGLPYDLTVWIASEDRYLYVEVKSSSVLNREWFFLTHEELDWARFYKDQYIIFYVSVDLKKPRNKQCKVIKMYTDPAHDPDLELSMVDVSKFRWK